MLFIGRSPCGQNHIREILILSDIDVSRPWPGSPREWGDDLRLAAGFLTRLPMLSRGDGAARPLAEAVRVFPLIGAALGLAAGLVYGFAAAIGLPPSLAAVLTLAALIAATGALHEDGLADSADGLGGVATPAAKLAIMRDHQMGAYGVIRISLPILPDEAVTWAPFIAILAVIGIIYGSLACLAQHDLKRLIAFSSVGHMGFVMLGISTMTDIGINAAIIGMVAHGLITGLLFFIAGSMQHRYHTREMARLGGNIKLMPVMGGIFAFTAMASLGLPGLAGFWGEFMSLVGAYNPLAGLPLGLFRSAMVIGAIGTVLTAGYMLWMLQRVNLGEPSDEWEGQEFHDVDRFELAAWVPMIVLIAVIGFFPKIVFNSTTDVVTSLVDMAFSPDTTASITSKIGG